MKVETFTVPARGVGRKDYSGATERSVQPFLTPTLRQGIFSLTDAIFTKPVYPFPIAWEFPVSMPQEDGSWGWLASSMPLHFFEIGVYIMTNHLVTIGLHYYASIEDYDAGNIAKRSPQIFGYGKAKLTFLKGIPTQQGCLYCMLAGGWPDTVDFDIGMTATGIVTDLTPPWME